MASGVDPAIIRDPNYVPAEAVLSRMADFDAGFFGLSPRDAAIMDPQCRHFLECSWHALEHAGHVPETFEGRIGVFAASGANRYFWQNVVRDSELLESVGFFLLRHTGNDKDFLPTTVSYQLDLTGPSVSVQTACSSSLVAVHYAAQSLLNWECDMVLAGGVTIIQPHGRGYVYQDGEILSPDGHCRSYDHRAEGTVFGSGVGVVVLRRLADALESGDTIHAVIRGSAINNDGSRKVSYLAPGVDGQAEVIAEALSVSGVSADSIGLLEGHGTATRMGDVIEVAALTQAFRTQTREMGFCALGSVKSNIGHLDTAAGVASLIKAVQSLKHGKIPPTVNFEEPNPALNLPSSPFFVNDRLINWPKTGGPRRTGVSSLGVGGTNVHVILEEAPDRVPSGPSRPWQLLTLSARSAAALGAASRDLVEHLEELADVSLADVSNTLRRGRRSFPHRQAVVCRSAEAAIEILATGAHEDLIAGTSDRDDRGVSFLFAGGGAQYPNMGRELYDHEPVFRRHVETCLSWLDGRCDFDLRALLFPDVDDEGPAATELQRPSRALPALFAIQYSQAQLWLSWGIEPKAMIGHSMGEYTAACLAGVFSVEDALSLVLLRGRLFESLAAGAMLSIPLSEQDLRPHLGEELSVAAINTPELTVAAGPVLAVEDLECRLTDAGIECRRIRIDVAAHSSMLEPILDEFGEYLRGIRFSEPRLPFVSNLTGRPAMAEEVTDSDYWVRHLRHTVRFSDGIEALLDPDGPVLLEVGPGRTLATLAKAHPAHAAQQLVLHSLPHPGEERNAQAFMLGALGALWTHGVQPDWDGFDTAKQRRRVPLPGYPFEHETYFVDPPTPTEQGADSRPMERSERSEDTAEWFYQPTWIPIDLPQERSLEGKQTLLVLTDEDGPGAVLAARLEASGDTVLRAHIGDGYSDLGDGNFRLRPGSTDDWGDLARALKSRGLAPDYVVHSWCMRLVQEDTSPAMDRAFFAPLFLLQALEETFPGHAFRLVALTTGAMAVAGDEVLDPMHALLAGPVRVAPRELPSVMTRLADVGPPPSEPDRLERYYERLLREIRDDTTEPVVALRGADRLAQRFVQVPVPTAELKAELREGGVYVVTGGLGGIGLVVARMLASDVAARLILLGRTGLPDPQDWTTWVAEHPTEDKTSRAIREVQALETMGAEVLVLAADVSDEEQLRAALHSATARFGGIDGVIHAAGILDDGPLLSKKREKAMSVLSPKVTGTLVLDRVIEQYDPDLMVVFSSISAVLGVPGQVDYAAANGFLDAFARERASRTGGRTLSLAWGAWRDVGMAAELAGTTTYGTAASGLAELDAPASVESEVFDGRLGDHGSVAFRTRFKRGRHWMLDEHHVRDGRWVMPGSGYVELIRAAYRELDQTTPIQLEDLVFVAPFGIDDAEERDLEVRLSPSANGHDVTISGREPGDSVWVEHARGHVRRRDDESGATETLQQVSARVGVPLPVGESPNRFMDFGPRWSNVRARSSAEREALLHVALADAFVEDVATVGAHPALLDLATAGAQDLIPKIDLERDFLVPVGFG